MTRDHLQFCNEVNSATLLVVQVSMKFSTITLKQVKFDTQRETKKAELYAFEYLRFLLLMDEML